MRNVGKLFQYNDSTRNLFESIGNIHVLSAIKTLISKNDMEDVILIGGLAVSYHSIPYHSNDIDILVKDKKKFKYFPCDKFKNGTILDVYDINDLGITEEMFDDMKNNSLVSNGIKIMQATHLMYLFMVDYNNYLRCIHFILQNSYIDDNYLKCNLPEGLYNKYRTFLIYSNKNYCMKYLKSHIEFVTYKLYEGNSGFPEVDRAFNDWISNSHNHNQVLIGGYAFMNYIQGDRSTYDVDFIFLSEQEIPTSVNKFKKTRDHCFRHISTHVEIETLTGDYLDIDENLVRLVFETAFDKGEYKIASPSSIVALKLDRLSIKDLSDIEKLINNYDVNLDEYIPFLSDKALVNLEKLKSEIKF